MKKLILLFSLIIASTLSYSQGRTKEIKTKGVFSEIAIEKQNKAIEKIQEKNKKNKKKKKLIIDNIRENPNDFNPPVLYALSRELFEQENKDEACYWFYLAQLRGRYDANLCMDNSAKQASMILTIEYGQDINKYALQDIDELEKTIAKVVNYVRENEENYDHRWINLHGMWAVQAGLSDKEENRELSKPKEEWEAIKKKTVDNYYNSFMEYAKSQKK